MDFSGVYRRHRHSPCHCSYHSLHRSCHEEEVNGYYCNHEVCAEVVIGCDHSCVHHHRQDSTCRPVTAAVHFSHSHHTHVTAEAVIDVEVEVSTKDHGMSRGAVGL
jgi:hypothetical protein